jgi:hypothetical protein
MEYKLIFSVSKNKNMAVNRSDGWSIPLDEANTDYKQYLEWVAEGNEAEVEEVE